MIFFCDSFWAKSGLLVSGVFLEVYFGTEKMVKAETRTFAISGKLSEPALL